MNDRRCGASPALVKEAHQSEGGGRCDQALDGEVCDGMKSQRHQLRSQVVPVDVTQQSFMGELEDGLEEMTIGRVFHEHQKRTEAETDRVTVRHSTSTYRSIIFLT